VEGEKDPVERALFLEIPDDAAGVLVKGFRGDPTSRRPAHGISRRQQTDQLHVPELEHLAHESTDVGPGLEH